MRVWELKDVITNTYSNLSNLLIQGDSWLMDITADDFLGLCDQKRHNVCQILDD
jgi:uncharacterized membrane protein YfhO